MRLGEDDCDLRLLAKADDREKAARRQWPAFEERLRQLGYGPRAIADAFCALSGPGTVAEALEVLRAPRPESHPIALSFAVTETRGGGSAASRVTITSVERDDSVIRVNYDVVPTPDLSSHRGRGEAKDDLGNHYRGLTGYLGISGTIDSNGLPTTRAYGRLTVPLPPPAARVLQIRITWVASDTIRMPWEPSLPSIWETPAHEIRVSLPD
jgi:hypothetical protein